MTKTSGKAAPAGALLNRWKIPSPLVDWEMLHCCALAEDEIMPAAVTASETAVDVRHQFAETNRAVAKAMANSHPGLGECGTTKGSSHGAQHKMAERKLLRRWPTRPIVSSWLANAIHQSPESQEMSETPWRDLCPSSQGNSIWSIKKARPQLRSGRRILVVTAYPLWTCAKGIGHNQQIISIDESIVIHICRACGRAVAPGV